MSAKHAKPKKYQQQEFTEAEISVLNCISRGLSNPEIASEMRWEYSTVKSYMAKLFMKTGFTTRTQLALWAQKKGYDNVVAAVFLLCLILKEFT